MTEFVAALRAEARVFSALLVREIGGRHGGDATGTTWLLFEPLLVFSVVYALHGLEVFHTPVAVPFILILMTGYMPHLALRHAGLGGLAALQANRGLLYHRQVHFFDVAYARVLVETVTVLISFTIVYFIGYVFKLLSTPYSLAYIYLGWFFNIWFIFIVAAFVTGAGLVWPLVRRIFFPWSLFMLIPYEAFTMLYWWPPYMQYYLSFFPCTNAVEITRYGYFGNAVPTIFYIGYTIESCLVLTVLGLLVMHWGRRHLEL
jgi:capsular polysaccharide transport system permease protein